MESEFTASETETDVKETAISDDMGTLPTNMEGESEESPFPLYNGDDTQEEESNIDDDVFGEVQKPIPCDPESAPSSLEELKIDDSLESEELFPDMELLSQQELKCLSSLKAIREITPELIDEIDSIFKQYHRAVNVTTTKRDESKEKIWWKLEDADIKEEQDEQSDSYNVDEKTKIPKSNEKVKEEKKDPASLEESVDLEQNFELDELHKKNQTLQDEKEVLQQRIEELEDSVDKIRIGDEAEMKEKTVSGYIKEIGKLRKELDVFEDKLIQCQSENKTLLLKLQNKGKEFIDMENMVKKYQDDTLKHETKRKSVEADIEKANSVMDRLKLSFNKQSTTLSNSLQQLSIKDDENLELKKAISGFNNQQECMSKYIVELRDRLEFLSQSYIQVEEQNTKLKELCGEQTGTLEVIKKKSMSLGNFEQKWISRLEIVNKRLRGAEDKAKKLSDELHLKVKEINLIEEESLTLKKKLKELEREKEEMINKMHQLSGIINEKDNQSEEQLRTISNLNLECIQLNKIIKTQEQNEDKLKKQNERSEKMVRKIENENELMTSTLQTTVQHLLNSEKAVQKKEKEVRDLVADYNNVLLEKNTLRSRLLQSYGNSKNIEFKFRYLNTVITYDKHKLDRSDDITNKLQYKVQQLQYNYTTLKIAFKEKKLEIRKLLEDVNYKEKEKGSLDRLIEKGENIRINVIKDAERLRQDVSILKTVIQRRNAEISLAYEKSQLMSSILNDSKHEMAKRLADIHLLKTEVLKIRAENKMLVKAVENNGNLKNEIHLLQKDLSQAKQKCCALEDQMENPINVHRWRILKGKDPEKNEQIHENQLLRKKIVQTENRYLLLKEKLHAVEVSYMNLKEKVKKTPEELNIINKLNEAQRIIKNKNAEIQRLSVTLRSYQFNTREIIKDVEKKKNKADECMKKYYDLKRIVDGENLNKTDDELLGKLPFEKTCFTDSKDDLLKRIMKKTPVNKAYEGTGLVPPKSNNKKMSY